MKLTKENIEEYINRFLEGETTNEEERAIYRFFREEEVPYHLEEYAPMFAWYEEGMPEETEASAEQKKRRHLPIEVWSIGIAAMIAVVIGIGIICWNEKDSVPSDWECYEGSYIEVSGKRITDVKQIMPTILETLSQAEHIERLAQERIEQIRLAEAEIQEKEMLVNN